MIRPATLQDLPQMLVNARKFIDATPYKQFPYDEGSMRDAFVEMMECGLCLVAEDDGKHLGGVGAVKAPLFFNRKVSFSGERFWWVEPEFRDSGIGKQLFKQLVLASKKAECNFLMMISLADPQVDEMYRRSGLVEVEHAFMMVL